MEGIRLLFFGPLKEAMGCKSFRFDEEVQQGLHSQPKEFFDIFMSKGYYIIV
jgi:hypothetical protein